MECGKPVHRFEIAHAAVRVARLEPGIETGIAFGGEFIPDCPLEAFPIVGASLLAKFFASKLAPTVGSWPNGQSGFIVVVIWPIEAHASARFDDAGGSNPPSPPFFKG